MKKNHLVLKMSEHRIDRIEKDLSKITDIIAKNTVAMSELTTEFRHLNSSIHSLQSSISEISATTHENEKTLIQHQAVIDDVKFLRRVVFTTLAGVVLSGSIWAYSYPKLSHLNDSAKMASIERSDSNDAKN